jgi:alpha-galactosidase
MTKLDAFSLNLLTNDEVIAVNQDELGKQATCVLRLEEIEGRVADIRIYAKDLADGGRAVAFFNLGAEPVKLEFKDFAKLGLSGRQLVRDLWRQKDIVSLDTSKDGLPLSLPGHGVMLTKFAAAK